jgi:hypothetical protein
MTTSSDIRKLNDELGKVSVKKEAARETVFELGSQQREIADQIARLEQEHGDEQAFKALRDRGGTDGAMAARTIAATMTDPDRAAQFEDLARELLDDKA